MNGSSLNDKYARFPDQESERLAQLKTYLERGGITYTILVHTLHAQLTASQCAPGFEKLRTIGG